MPTTNYPPGPTGPWPKRNLAYLQQDRLGFFERCARDYGDFVTLTFPGAEAFFLADPDLIEQVLVQKYRQFQKNKGLRTNRIIFGNGLLVSDGDFWRRQRKLAQPAFHRERIQGYAKIMVDAAERHIEGWQDGQECDINAEMLAVTLVTVVKTLFDTEVKEDVEKIGAAMEVGQECAKRRIEGLFMIPEWAPLPIYVRLRRAMRSLDEIIYGLIEERRKSGKLGNDLLSMLIAATDEDDGSHMDDKQLRDELMTLFLAGHETTALALSWTFYLLAQNPEAERKLHEEIDAVLNGRLPTPDDRPRLEYTANVIAEAMRLYPPAWMIGREALEDVTIGDYTIRKGATLLMSPWVSHRDPRYFDDPLAFKPERWENDLRTRLPKYAYYPFGGGPRICIGNMFALMEATLMLATFARRFRLSLEPGQHIELEPAITLRPRQGIRMRLHARQPAALEAAAR